MDAIYFLLSIFIAKSIYMTMRLCGYQASTYPGYVVEKMNKFFLQQIRSRYKESIILVSGTNGKTTTTTILSSILGATNKIVLSNESGSNMSRGIISLLTTNCSWLGRLKADYLVLEVDEAYMPLVAEQLLPDVVLLLNVTRDQLDRYGEVVKTAQLLGRAAEFADKVVVNYKDKFIVNATTNSKHKRLFFTASTDIHKQISNEDDFATVKETQSRINKRIDVILTSYEKKKNDIYQFKILCRDSGEQEFTWKVSGLHNVLNATAAIAVSRIFIKDIQTISNGLKHVSLPLGRGSVVNVAGKDIRLCLIKNPAGFTQSINSYLDLNSKTEYAIFINDNIADGQDISWLWDVRLDKLLGKLNRPIFVGGNRRYDTALCLKYQKIDYKLLADGDSTSQFIDLLKCSTGNKIIVFHTYTAMTEITKHLEKLKCQRYN